MKHAMVTVFLGLVLGLAHGASPDPTLKTGVVTFVDGQVEALTGGAWVGLLEGDRLAETAQVRTGTQSSAEIQFGSLGVVRISASSRVALSAITLGSDKRSVDLELASGALTVKVAKLLGDDRFLVKTKSVACGVRGTFFGVSTDGGDDTTVGVTEGEVALVPPSYDPASVADAPAEAFQLARGLFRQILDASQKVGVGTEVVVRRSALEAAGQALNKVQTFLKDAADKARRGQALNPVEGVRQAVDEFRRALPPPGSLAPKPLGEALQRVFGENPQLQLRANLPPPPPGSLLPPAPGEPGAPLPPGTGPAPSPGTAAAPPPPPPKQQAPAPSPAPAPAPAPKPSAPPPPPKR